MGCGGAQGPGWPAQPPPSLPHRPFPHGVAQASAQGPREHLPCFPLPHSPLGGLCVLGGQGPPGRVWRNQEISLLFLKPGSGTGPWWGWGLAILLLSPRSKPRPCVGTPQPPCVGTPWPPAWFAGTAPLAGRLGRVLWAGRRPWEGGGPSALARPPHGQAIYL